MSKKNKYIGILSFINYDCNKANNTFFSNRKQHSEVIISNTLFIEILLLVRKLPNIRLLDTCYGCLMLSKVHDLNGF